MLGLLVLQREKVECVQGDKEAGVLCVDMDNGYDVINLKLMSC